MRYATIILLTASALLAGCHLTTRDHQSLAGKLEEQRENRGDHEGYNGGYSHGYGHFY